MDALEREVSDTLSKVEDICASIVLDNEKIVLDVYDYPLIDKEKSIDHKASTFSNFWHKCFSELFYFCKGKRNLIF